jgi:MoaA/NifB/PqqE/SkfB family radical SAM enzyme
VPQELSQKCDGDSTFTKQCGTGSSSLTIDPMGNILPCVQWRRSVGNLHQDKISDLWSTSADLEDIRETAIKARKLVSSFGPKGNLMGYCIGEAICQTGSPLEVYPIAKKQMDARLKVIIK